MCVCPLSAPPTAAELSGDSRKSLALMKVVARLELELMPHPAQVGTPVSAAADANAKTDAKHSRKICSNSNQRREIRAAEFITKTTSFIFLT